jgi:hypothetical protein
MMIDIYALFSARILTNFLEKMFERQPIPVLYMCPSTYRKANGITKRMTPIYRPVNVYDAGNNVFKEYSGMWSLFSGISIALRMYEYLPGLRIHTAPITLVVTPDIPFWYEGYLQEKVTPVPKDDKNALAFAKILEKLGFDDIFTGSIFKITGTKNIGRRPDGQYVLYDIDYGTLPFEFRPPWNEHKLYKILRINEMLLNLPPIYG